MQIMQLIGIELKPPTVGEIFTCGVMATMFSVSVAFAGWYSGGGTPVRYIMVTWLVVFVGMVASAAGLSILQQGWKAAAVLLGLGGFFGSCIVLLIEWAGLQ